MDLISAFCAFHKFTIEFIAFFGKYFGSSPTNAEIGSQTRNERSDGSLILYVFYIKNHTIPQSFTHLCGDLL